MIVINSLHEVNRTHVGKYIVLGGQGILDGLKYPPTKYSAHKITGLDNDGLHLRAYRAKNGCYIPTWNFSQEAAIYDHKEYKDFPAY